tara:strand:+ start:1492 stop:1752 length:261 start_codon:yes stop_codon:yes gene_type:complete
MTAHEDELALTLGALELGIIPPNVKSIDSALATLSIEDARVAKRKFRKLKRKLITPDTKKLASPIQVRALVANECWEVGWRIIRKT